MSKHHDNSALVPATKEDARKLRSMFAMIEEYERTGILPDETPFKPGTGMTKAGETIEMDRTGDGRYRITWIEKRPGRKDNILEYRMYASESRARQAFNRLAV